MENCHLDLSQSSYYDLEIDKFRDLNQELIAEVFSGSTYLAPFEFTPYSAATLQVRVKKQDDYTLLTFSTSDGSIVLDNNGVFSLNKSASQLEKVKAGEFYYDMYLSRTGALKRAFLHGKFTINQNVSL